MMKFAFDLVSDLHIEAWKSFDWSNRATSPYCVIAGDIARNTEVVKQTLRHISQQYQAVFYIDGNEEHKDLFENLDASYLLLGKSIKKLKDIVYLHGNIIIINGVALVATNGWYSFDFDPLVNNHDSQEWYEQNYTVTSEATNRMKELAQSDAMYLYTTIQKLQMHNDVKKIVIITHTVPQLSLIDHDIDLSGSFKVNCMGNKYLNLALDEDTENKISTWCFGHYHGPVDTTVNNIRYINNCRGRPDAKWCQEVYHPKRIEIEV